MGGENLPTIQSVLNHKSLAATSIYARLNTTATDRALQTQADRLCNMVLGVEVLPALTQERLEELGEGRHAQFQKEASPPVTFGVTFYDVQARSTPRITRN